LEDLTKAECNSAFALGEAELAGTDEFDALDRFRSVKTIAGEVLMSSVPLAAIRGQRRKECRLGGEAYVLVV